MRMNLVENATQQIKEMIVAKQYDDSGYLPCEGDLCKLLGVWRFADWSSAFMARALWWWITA